jgi:hypothetical protein
VAALILASPEGLYEGAQEKGDWEQASRDFKRLPPSAFKELPRSIVMQLESQGCMIPKATEHPDQHSVIRGEFARKGQIDWAVLCSKKGVSSIQIIWGKPTTCPRELAPSEDRYWFERLGEFRSEYSRSIDSVGRKYILDHYQAYGGPKPPPIHHQGIDDGFLGKFSVIYYCHESSWITLQGAD